MKSAKSQAPNHKQKTNSKPPSSKQVLRSRFKAALDSDVMKFISSIKEDEHLIEQDILANMAHVKMLSKSGLITPDQEKKMLNGLISIKKAQVKLTPEREDVHMAIEAELAKKTSDSHALRTARSRNDLVATDLKLFVRDETKNIQKLLLTLQKMLAAKAKKNLSVIMPGYTHLQRAQPVLFSHVLFSFFEQLARDMQRFTHNLQRLDVSPLGSCALAGTSLKTNPAASAGELGFTGVFQNSIDAVSDRDFIADFLYACSMTAIHLSQISECLIIWSTSEFSFIELPDVLTTGSSLMPQKKNPDLVELVRGKTGRTVGALVDILVNLKGLYFGYNRDLQETKPPMIETTGQISSSLKIITLAIQKMIPNRKKMHEAADDESMLATDVAEYLVKKGVPFNLAHEAVAIIMKKFSRFSKTSLQELKSIRPEFSKDVYDILSPKKSILNKKSAGSTGLVSVKKSIKDAFMRLKKGEKNLGR